MSKARKKRVGRGAGSGVGKTSGRGMKGQRSRSGFNYRVCFEGGQMPLARRVPKRGFKNPFRKEYQAVNVKDLAARFEDGATVTPDGLREKGLVRHAGHLIKVLGDGEISIALAVQADAFTASAREKIVKAGGEAQPRQVAA
ncbi:MAG: 50S ribosomal protein L15 [bacterium]